MGTALLKGWLRDHGASKHQERLSFSACVRTQQSLDRLERSFNEEQRQHCTFSKGTTAAVSMAAKADIVVLGCAPSDYESVLGIEDMIRALEGKILVSLLAGVSYQQLKAGVVSHGGQKDSLRLARVLPTLGAQNGSSVTLIGDLPSWTPTSDHMPRVTTLFDRIGTINLVPEDIFAEATALGATCHALTIVAADTLADASAADGIPRALAMSIATRCLQSASGLLGSGMTVAEMKEAMAIPTGITINTVLQLEREARPAIADSARHAISYTRSMSS